MMMIYATPGDAQPVLLDLPETVELGPVYGEKPARKPQLSASDLRCAALMLEKLRRREDVLDRAVPDDAGRVLEVVVEKLLEVL
jgi:hypothetical protein